MAISTDRLVAWVQVLTGLAVLAGLVLVAVELRQARSIATAEQVGSHLDNIFETSISSLGEVNVAPIMVKGCLTPTELSLDELYVYTKVISLDMGRAGRGFWVEEAAEQGHDWEGQARGFYSDLLGSEIGRARYRLSREYLAPPLRAIADEIIQDKSYIPCERWLTELKDEMKKDNLPPSENKPE